MSEIEEAVARAMKDSLIEQGVWMQREEQGGVVAIQVDGHVDFEDLARAAIEAYEEATRVVFDEKPAVLRSDKTRRRDPYGRSEFER